MVMASTKPICVTCVCMRVCLCVVVENFVESGAPTLLTFRFTSSSLHLLLLQVPKCRQLKDQLRSIQLQQDQMNERRRLAMHETCERLSCSCSCDLISSDPI